MSINARRMLDRLEIEDMSHGGYENGNLIVTYKQFVSAGIRRQSIPKSIEELENLGWIEVQRGGIRGFARSWPHRYRLTHRRTRVRPNFGNPYFIDATNEWRGYRSRKSIQMGPDEALPSCRNRHLDSPSSRNRSSDTATVATAGSVTDPVPLYISRVGRRGRTRAFSSGMDRYHRPKP